jgi:3-deoxy-D-manno-octulosonic-acid transferase
LFRRAGAVVEVDRDSFASELLGLLNDPDRRAELGRRAAALVQLQRGATDRTVTAIAPLLAQPGELLAHGGAR